MNPAAQIATALSPYMEPSYAALLGTAGLFFGMFATAVLVGMVLFGTDEEVSP